MKDRYRLFLRRKSVYYAFDNTTRTFQSLKTKDRAEAASLTDATDALARQIESLGRWTPGQLREPGALDALRGAEGMGSATYFGVFSLMLKQQQDAFAFPTRSRRPPRDRINCLLSFLYALVRHDSIAALTSIGLDPFVGFLHAEVLHRLLDESGLDLALLGQRPEGGDHRAFCVHLEEAAKPCPLIAAAETVDAERHQSGGSLWLEHVGRD